jgi:hypothetical protein
MNNAIIHRVQGFLSKVSKEGVELDPKLVKEFRDACEASIHKQFSPSADKWRPRMSSLGRPLCQQKMERDGADKDIEYNAILRFIFGDLVEAISVLILKSAGVNVEGEQERVKLKLGKNEVSGTLDIVIDGKVWDIKSASPYAFEHKFGEMGGYNKIKEDDTFGYITQGYLYSESKNKDFGGWIVINKASGEWNVCEAPVVQDEDRKEFLQLAKNNLNALLKGEKFKRCFSDTTETYKDDNKNEKKTGNRLLPSICGFCDFKRKCWPDAILHKKVGSKARYPRTVWYSKLVKREV